MSMDAYYAKNGPYRGHRFTVEIDGLLTAGFAEVSGFGVRVQTEGFRWSNDFRSANVEIPTLSQFDNITFSQGIIYDITMLQWVMSAASSASKGPSGEKLRRDILVTLQDAAGNPRIEWRIASAFPVSYRIDSFNAMRADTVMESLEVSHAGFDMKLCPEKK